MKKHFVLFMALLFFVSLSGIGNGFVFNVYMNKPGIEKIIEAPVLKALLQDSDLRNNPLLLDGRPRASFEAGTIPGSIWIEVCSKMITPGNRAKLEAALNEHYNKTGNKKIVVWCGNGYSSMQLATVLGGLGYDIKALKYGFHAWTGNDADFKKSANVPGGPVEIPAKLATN